jgi:hypothetical protein
MLSRTLHRMSIAPFRGGGGLIPTDPWDPRSQSIYNPVSSRSRLASTSPWGSTGSIGSMFPFAQHQHHHHHETPLDMFYDSFYHPLAPTSSLSHRRHPFEDDPFFRQADRMTNSILSNSRTNAQIRRDELQMRQKMKHQQLLEEGTTNDSLSTTHFEHHTFERQAGHGDDGRWYVSTLFDSPYRS